MYVCMCICMDGHSGIQAFRYPHVKLFVDLDEISRWLNCVLFIVVYIVWCTWRYSFVDCMYVYV